jgi:uncharacterized repeat protein (TIGR03809 family)
MTEAIGTLRDYQAMRWRKLAERRLEHMTELFVSGRWQRYFGERDFLETVRQSKALVAAWRTLEPRDEPDSRLPHTPFAVTGPVNGDEPRTAAPAAQPAAQVQTAVSPRTTTSSPPTPAPVVERKPARLASLLPSPFEDPSGVVTWLRPRRP